MYKISLIYIVSPFLFIITILLYKSTLLVSHLQTPQLIASQIMSYIEYLMCSFCNKNLLQKVHLADDL